MNVILIQHTAVDTPGVIQDHLERQEIATTVIRLDLGETVPTAVDADTLMTFGGPQSLHLPELPEWVGQQQRLIRRYIDDGRKVFGICLGAQLIASALGASSGPNSQREVGWHDITLTSEAERSPLASHLPQQQTVLHWHQNTFELPSGATHLYRSRACENQAFSVGDQVLALQFHPETSAKTVQYYLKVSKLVGMPGQHVQSPDQIERGIAQHLVKQNEMICHLMTAWLGLKS